jgi:hypothetical protein
MIMKNLWVLFGLMVAVMVGCGTDPNSADCERNTDCGDGYLCAAEKCIEKPGELTIESFTATSLVVQPGEPSALEWQIQFATSAQLFEGDTLIYEIPAAEIASGSFEVIVDKTSLFRLVASDGTNDAEASVTLEVSRDNVIITSFDTSATTISFGGSARLTWTTDYATTGRIVDDSDRLVITLDTEDLGAGSLEVRPDSSVRYRLLVQNQTSEAEKEVGLEVLDANPRITLFAALRTSLTSGDSTQLRWEVANTESIQISQNGAVLLESDEDSGSLEVTPAETTTYTLTATNQQGSTTQDLVLEVFEAIVVDTFEATPAAVIPGAQTTLTWAISGDTSNFGIRDSQGNNVDVGNQTSVSGSAVVSPTQTTTYILTASNPAESVNATETVTLLPSPPQINSFTSNVSLVAIGATAQLSWSITRAASVSIMDELGNSIDLTALSPVADSVVVVLDGPHTFTLTASNAGGQTTADVFIDAAVGVAITSFQSDVAEVAAGEPVTLTWATTDATALILDSSIGAIDISAKVVNGDSVIVNPTQSTTYTLTANGLPTSLSSTVTVLVRTPVTISSFTASNPIINAGEQATLSWVAPGATNVTLECTDDATLVSTPIDIAALAPTGGNVSVGLLGSSLCTLTAQGFRGPVSDSLNITVNPILPQVATFSVSSEVIRLGESVTLTWETNDATSLVLTDDLGVAVDVSALNVDTDSIVITPTRSASFTLAALNADGVDTAAVSVVAVDTENLLINEIFYDAANADDGLEFVELYNAGQTFIDLQYFSLGAGGSSLAASVLQLSGIIPPGGCFVVGGPASTVENGFADFDLATLFPTPLQNGGAVSDGIGLFFELASDVTSTSIPVDSVLYEGANTSLLLGEDGQPDNQISPEAAGASLHRRGLSDIFEVGPMNAGTCFWLEAVQPSVASNQASGTVSVSGWALDAALDQVSIGTQIMTCVDTSSGLDCDLLAAIDAGLVDVSVVRINQYVDDGNGTPVLSPVAPAAQRSLVETDAFLFENEIQDSGLDFWCGITSTDVTTTTTADVTITAEIYAQGSTDVTGLIPVGAIVEAVIVPVGNPPMSVFSPIVLSAQYDGFFGNNALFSVTTTSALPLDAEVAFRYGNGVDFVWCDTVANVGSDDGYSIGSLVSWQ